MRCILIPGRTAEQGRYISIGKDKDEYIKIVNTLQMNAQDLAALGLVPGMEVYVRSEWGDATFKCVQGDLPPGVAFVPYGPPTSPLMSGQTDGTGMPIQKGMEVEILAAAGPAKD